VIIGDAGVGKTSIKNSYLGMDYVDNYTMTLGMETGLKVFEKNSLHIFDIGGQSGFSMDEYFQGAHGAIIVFDITSRESFQHVNKWMEVVSIRVGHMIPAVLVGNKSDLRLIDTNQVSLEEANRKSAELSGNSIYEIPYFETSAKTGLNVDHLFEFLKATMWSLFG